MFLNDNAARTPLDTSASRAKADEPIEMPFGTRTATPGPCAMNFFSLSSGAESRSSWGSSPLDCPPLSGRRWPSAAAAAAVAAFAAMALGVTSFVT